MNILVNLALILINWTPHRNPTPHSHRHCPYPNLPQMENDT